MKEKNYGNEGLRQFVKFDAIAFLEGKQLISMQESPLIDYDNCPLNKSTLSKWLQCYSKIAGVSRTDGRGLRHSNASYLIAELGADVLTVSLIGWVIKNQRQH